MFLVFCSYPSLYVSVAILVYCCSLMNKVLSVNTSLAVFITTLLMVMCFWCWQMFSGATWLASRCRHSACHPAACTATDTWLQVCWDVCHTGRSSTASWAEPVTALPGLLLSCCADSSTHPRGWPCSSPWHGKGDIQYSDECAEQLMLNVLVLRFQGSSWTRMAVVPLPWLRRQLGIHCRMNCETRISTVPPSDTTWRRFCFNNTGCIERIRGAVRLCAI